jgi:hypothetical protein
MHLMSVCGKQKREHGSCHDVFLQLVFQLHSNSGISALDKYKPVQTCHSQAILVSKLLRQIANAWNADIGYR